MSNPQKPNDGGPAFPHMGKLHRHNPETGITIMEPIMTGGISARDYFAAACMQGICAHNDSWGLQVVEIAGQAYAMADAMLKAREVKP